MNTQFQSLPETDGTLKESDRPIVLPEVVTDAALWCSVSWKHLLQICNEYAEFAAHKPNSYKKNTQMKKCARQEKNNDFWSLWGDSI